MDGIFTYIWLEFMVNVGKYAIHGSYGPWLTIKTKKTISRGFLAYMGVSKNNGFSLQIINFNRIFHHFRHPFGVLLFLETLIVLEGNFGYAQVNKIPWHFVAYIFPHFSLCNLGSVHGGTNWATHIFPLVWVPLLKFLM